MRMSTVHLPRLAPAAVPAAPDVPWPTHRVAARRTPAPRRARRSVVDEIFTRRRPRRSRTRSSSFKADASSSSATAGVREFFDRPAEPITAASPLLSWSMAKSMLAHASSARSSTRVDSTLDELAPVPEWRARGRSAPPIRVRDLLAMRDGLDFVEVYEIGQTSDVIEMLFGEGKDDMAAFTAAARPSPTSRKPFFNYSSGTTNILSRIVADQVGYGDAYRAVPRTASLRTTRHDERRRRPSIATGVFVASSFVHATALDFAKFGLLYLRGGELGRARRSSRAVGATPPRFLSSVDEETGTFYSWQWWVTGDEFGTYWASGYEGQMISVVPALDALIVRFGHTPEENYPDARSRGAIASCACSRRLGALVGETEVGRAKERA